VGRLARRWIETVTDQWGLILDWKKKTLCIGVLFSYHTFYHFSSFAFVSLNHKTILIIKYENLKPSLSIFVAVFCQLLSTLSHYQPENALCWAVPNTVCHSSNEREPATIEVLLTCKNFLLGKHLSSAKNLVVCLLVSSLFYMKMEIWA
jgi:hypothetical protein